jgi:hypothetical protein
VRRTVLADRAQEGTRKAAAATRSDNQHVRFARLLDQHLRRVSFADEQLGGRHRCSCEHDVELRLSGRLRLCYTILVVDIKAGAVVDDPSIPTTMPAISVTPFGDGALLQPPVWVPSRRLKRGSMPV